MARGQELSASTREKIVALHEHTSKSQRQIARDLNVSQASVNDILKKYHNTGSTRSLSRSGRPKVTSPRQDNAICRSSMANPFATASQIKRNNPALSNVNKRTIQRRLKERFGPVRKPAKKPILTPLMRQKRIEFCRQYLDWDVEQWKRVLFSDEATFQFKSTNHRFVRRPPGISRTHPNYTQKTIKHAPYVMVWGCFSHKCRGALSLLPPRTSVNKEKYLEILQEKLPIFMNICETSIFQHDKATPHMAKIVSQWLEQQQIEVLEWPGNSPDLNPIENLWEIVRQKLADRVFNSMEDFKQAIKDVWCREISQDYCKNLVSSMPRRLQAVIENKGFPTKY